ncbi:protein ALP1-like [Phragmites australis]|uniref:protein ALP1-like n=1 Tax=Phragmites australis TaxID=29695 RepID=UPI002D788127|nr:protein ALP1-like [Phragmites australis]
MSSSDTDSSSDDDYAKKLDIALKRRKLVLDAANVFAMYYGQTFLKKAARRQPDVTGYDWVIKTLNQPRSCYKMFRITRAVFDSLHDTLVSNYGLKSTSSMTSIDSLAMFLWTCGAPQSFSQIDNRFERSNETISRKLAYVLNCVNNLAVDIIKPRDPHFVAVHSRLQDPRFSPHFNDCIGAIDGTHIPVVVPSAETVAHVGRYRYTTQNVLAVCDFDMRFTFVVSGWPGSVHDTRVFNEALNNYADKFPFPPEGINITSKVYLFTSSSSYR